MSTRDGMNYAPTAGNAEKVVKPGEFVFATAFLDHGHIQGQMNGLLEAGGECRYVYDPQPERARAFAEKNPGVKVAASFEEVLEDEREPVGVGLDAHRRHGLGVDPLPGLDGVQRGRIADGRIFGGVISGGGVKPDLARARRLFARALETPGGLKIQTLHAFCESLLRRFPLEAGLPPGFEVQDDATGAALKAEALDAVTEAALKDPASEEAKAIARLLEACGPDALSTLIGFAANRRHRLEALLDEAGSVEALMDRASLALGVEPETVDALVITHEHRDHTSGMGILARRFGWPLHLSEATAEACDDLLYGEETLRFYRAEEPFRIGGLEFRPFLTCHDSVEPLALAAVESETGHKVGLATDLGRATTSVRAALRDCHFLILEANHDEVLLEASLHWVVLLGQAKRNIG